MKLVILAIKDSALDAFMRPMFVPHRNAGVRAFTDEVNRQESEMNKHPDDYELYELATWDEQTGRFNNTEQLELLVRGKDVYKGERK